MSRKIKNLLYKSFEKSLSERDQRLLNEALAASEDLRGEKVLIETLREKARQTAVTGFSAGFTDRVMEHVLENHHQEEMLFESLISFFRPVAFAALLLLVGLIFYNISETNQYSIEGAYAISDISVEEAFDPIVDLTVE